MQPPATSALVIHPYLKRTREALRTPESCLEEAAGLARAIALDVKKTALVPMASIRPASLIGVGKMEELQAIVESEAIELAIMDHALSPIQQKNLETALGCKVIDRTALILEIFGARARTNEGKLQVELASLEYQKGRLVRSWTHLERQRGGFGFLGGPGETQIEADRRMIRDRIALIKKELATVTRTRKLHRKVRQDAPYPVVALVGYTNAGKSTLFNRLTGAQMFAENLLFATLDPTLRKVKLPSGTFILLSDTVGFISNLPHELVAAFRATLEEVREAKIILHVRDISHPESSAQKEDVEKVLSALFQDEPWNERIVEVLNKVDLLSNQNLETGNRKPDSLAISALTGEGSEKLLAMLDEKLQEALDPLTLKIPASEGKAIAWLYSHGTVEKQTVRNGKIHLRVRLSAANYARFTKHWPQLSQ